MIQEFGTLGNVLEASPHRLGHLLPDDRNIVEQIVAARNLVHIGLKQRVDGRPVRPDDAAMHDYLRNRLGNSAEERLAAVYVAASGHFLADDIVGVGCNASISVCMRTLFRRAFDLGANALLLAHNHPSGKLAPSALDVVNTRRLQSVARSLNIVLIDHLIITAAGAFSMMSDRVL